ncbi:hypothetical protein, partial [Klebsiella pneumoniae]|uniref:hypothetical protein n=1 Tax=Klebsiella pneumoniae TaxID=573 RepID=UPI003013CBC6
EGLIHTRDGIVGTWSPPNSTPVHLALDDPRNLERWEIWVRASVIDFELYSRLGFSSAAAGQMSVWYVDTPGAGNAPPNCVYRPLMAVTR